MKLIIDIPRKVNEHIRSWYGHGYFPQNEEDRNIIAKAIYDSTPIPDNATNGEVVKATTNFIGVQDEEDTIKISTSWWNAPYQKGGK